jgi:hypothetical protein
MCVGESNVPVLVLTIAADNKNGNLVVCDRKNNRILCFCHFSFLLRLRRIIGVIFVKHLNSRAQPCKGVAFVIMMSAVFS